MLNKLKDISLSLWYTEYLFFSGINIYTLNKDYCIDLYRGYKNNRVNYGK